MKNAHFLTFSTISIQFQFICGLKLFSHEIILHLPSSQIEPKILICAQYIIDNQHFLREQIAPFPYMLVGLFISFSFSQGEIAVPTQIKNQKLSKEMMANSIKNST